MAFLPNIGPVELIIVLAIVILILGPKRIPAAARSIGHGMRNFRDSLGGGNGDEEKYEDAKSELDEKNKTEA
ncbi:MAG TPA: twin-arginine translocase TatA/TatE family subunit [Solirubrobacterales bacterium]|nr:twin-arginine translocase TatA/TatE family subunit [Solirubrobacterales bacterium]